MLCGSRHRRATPQCFHLPKLKLSPLNTTPHSPSSTVFSDSMNLTIQGTSYKWNQTVFAPNMYWNAFLRLSSYMSYKQDFYPHPVLYSRFLTAIRFIHSSVYMSIPTSQSIPTLLPRWCPSIGSLRLRLHFCFAMNRFICTIVPRFHMYALM